MPRFFPAKSLPSATKMPDQLGISGYKASGFVPHDLKEESIEGNKKACLGIIMGILTVRDEYTSLIPPARLFSALIIDYPNLIPKLIPQVVVSVDVHPPEGGVGSIRQTNFAQGDELGFVKNRVEELNKETLTYKYTLIEGGPLVEGRIEKIACEVKFTEGADGGSVNRLTTTYHTIGDVELSEEEIRRGREKALAMYKLVEAYLIQNSEAYA